MLEVIEESQENRNPEVPRSTQKVLVVMRRTNQNNAPTTTLVGNHHAGVLNN